MTAVKNEITTTQYIFCVFFPRWHAMPRGSSFYFVVVVLLLVETLVKAEQQVLQKITFRNLAG
jgi:hypothetical protein